MTKRRQWVQVQRGVYLVAPGRATWRQLARAAQLAGGDALALDAGCALRFWGVDGVQGDAIELTVIAATKQPRPAGVRVRYPSRAVATRVRDGVRVVCVGDALLSLSALTKDRRQLEVVVESVLLARRSSERRLWRFVAMHARRGVRGVALLRSVLERRPNGNPSRSVLELEVLDLIRASGLPVPTRNATSSMHMPCFARSTFAISTCEVPSRSTANGGTRPKASLPTIAGARRRWRRSDSPSCGSRGPKKNVGGGFPGGGGKAALLRGNGVAARSPGPLH